MSVYQKYRRKPSISLYYWLDLTVMRAFIIVFCLLSVRSFAQAPYLERDDTDAEFRRIDPAGIISTTINNPLPFRYGIPSENPVSTKYHFADYYCYNNNSDGVYEYTRSVSYDQHHRIIDEKQLNKFTGQINRQTSFQYDNLGRIKIIRNYSFDRDLSALSLASIRKLFYDEVDGILIADTTFNYSENKLIISGIELIRNQKNKPVVVKSFLTTNGNLSHTGYFELNYQGDSISEIIQYSQAINGEKIAPIYRHYKFRGSLVAPILITDYSSAWMENGQWKDYRINHQEAQKNLKVFESTSLSGLDMGTIIRNQYHTDAFGNLIAMTQETVNESFSEKAGELRYDIEYDKITGNPSKITTFFLDENHNMQPSLRIEASNDLSFINKTELSGFSVFPNPASNIVNIHWNNDLLKNVTLELKTITGEIVKHIDNAPNDSGSTTISLNDVAPGIYQISLSDGMETKTIPLIVLENK